MGREFARSRRVEEQVTRILSEAIGQELRDPRIHGVVITATRVAKDLSAAQVYYTLLGSSGPSPEVQEGLERAAGFLRSRLARELNTRTVPELQFRYDEAGDRARRLDALIDEANAPRADGSDEGGAGDPDVREP